MNRKISYTLGKIERMREQFEGTDREADINELADKYTKIVTSPNGVGAEILHIINSNISALGIR